MDNTARLRCWVQPVAIETDETKPRFCRGKSLGQHAIMRFGQIEIVHRTGDVEIRIGIETVDKAQPLIAQIAFHLKICVKAKAFRAHASVGAVLQTTAEFFG